MKKSAQAAVPAVAGINLDVRPTSYWDADDPTSAIVQNIKGQLRREMARDFLGGTAPEMLGEIESELLEDTLTRDTREHLGRLGPSWMGGEYLPDYVRGEVEIARIVLQSVTMDVYSIRARRIAHGKRIGYRVVDEYASTWELTRKSSSRPLSLRELIALIDAAENENGNDGYPMVENIVRFQLENGDDAERAVGFVSVESTVYPMVALYYGTRVLAWAEAWVAEHREPEEEDEDAE